VALSFEAAIVLRAARGRQRPPVTVADFADRDRTLRRLARLIADGADGVVSFGIAGALDLALAPGTLVLAETVVEDGGGIRWAVDAAWRQALLAGLPAHVPRVGGTLVSVKAPATTAVAKSALFGASGAVAVDMESAIAGRVAAERKLPFLVVRAIADDASLGLPRAALAGASPSGAVRPWAVAAALARRPGDLPALLHLARATARARRTLAAAAPAVIAGG
jgi:hopanoid-associated phosphorylase